MTELKKIGYIGMGIMGKAMAHNLLNAGYELMIWNRSPEKCTPLVQSGATQMATPAEMAEAAPDVICINVSDTPDVEAVSFGHQGLMLNANPGLIVIDHSTISPSQTVAMAEEAAIKEVTWLDAPVSGGDVGAQKGTLSIMVGGEEAAYERCRKLFEVVGSTITHLGQAGMGQLCKACNQVAVSMSLLGTCEAMALAKKSGLDLTKMIEVVGGGAGGSWQLSNLGPKISEQDFAPGFMVDLILKDLSIVLDEAADNGLTLEGTSLVRDYFERLIRQNPACHGQLGTQAIAKILEQQGRFEY